MVPLFQRRYVWNQDAQWEPLWQDIVRVAERRSTRPQEKPEPHFLGAVVVQQLPHSMGNSGPLDRIALFAYRTSTLESEVIKPLVLYLLDPNAPAIPREQVEKALSGVESWIGAAHAPSADHEELQPGRIRVVVRPSRLTGPVASR